MTKSLTVKRLRGASILKITVLGTAVGFALLCTVFGVFALFGAELLQWNGAYITGPKALVAGPFIGLFVGGLFGLFAGISAYVGLRLFARFKPLHLEYLPLDDDAH